MKLLFILLVSFLGLCQAARSYINSMVLLKRSIVFRWLMLGGYTNVEGGPDTRPLDTVELVTLDQEGECPVTDVRGHIVTYLMSRPVCQPGRLVLQVSLPPAPGPGHSDCLLGQHLGLPPSTAWYINHIQIPNRIRQLSKM